MANPANSSSGSDPAADDAARKNDALWYTFQGIGRAYLISRGSPASSDARASGVHGYPTIEQAQANGNIVSTLVQATISQWDEYASLPFGGGTLGVIETVNITAPHDGKPAQYSTEQNPSTAAAKQDIPGLGALDAGFRQLTKVSMWRSLGWIMLGGIAVGLGVWWYAKSEAEQGVTSLVRGETPHLTAPVLPLALAGTGLYLIWFGVSYWEDVETVWPSDPVKAILQGKGLPVRVPDSPASIILSASESSNLQQTDNSGSDSTVSPSASQKQFIQSLLKGIHAPDTPANEASLANWMSHEEPSSDWSHWNNPFNTTLTLPGATSQNSVGVKSYTSLTQGLQATIDTLNNGDYGDILLMLRSGQGLKSGAAKGLSIWSGGAYSSV